MSDVRKLASAALLAALSTTVAAGGCEGLREGPRGLVTEVTDGDTVVLDTGAVVRLIGTQAPKLPLGRDGFEAWPMADEARDALVDLALGAAVIVRHGGERMDRHGRVLGHMFLIDEAEETWVQGEMIATGMARVYSFPDNRACLATLLELEARARVEGLGIWRDPYYSLRRADRPADLLERTGNYELVEGRVLLAEASGRLVYLNFGRYWKEDFTIVIERPALRLFADAGLNPLDLEGALVRVRGWIDDRDGPRVEVTHPEQIEILANR